MPYHGDNDWFSDRVVDENTLTTRDSCSGSNMPCLKMAYDYIKDCHKIIDLGCGTGNTVKWFNKQGHDAIGITFNSNEVKFANEKGNNAIYYGNMQDLKYEDNSFDAITSFESIEHVPDIFAVLNEIKRVAKPGCKIVIYIPGQVWVECPYHLICPTIRQFKHLINMVGLTLDHIHDFGDQECVYFIKKGV